VRDVRAVRAVHSQKTRHRTYKNTFCFKKMSNIKLNLLDNSLDYIYESLEPMLSGHDDTSKHSWKYSVLHLYSGIELLLKEKLRKEHWSLIFQDISSADSENLENGNFVSVYHDELIKRLRKISKVKFNDKPIKELRDLRNKFEHFEVDISLSECQNIVVAALDEIIKFWEIYLKSSSTVEQQKKFITIKSIVTEFDVYIKQRIKKFEAEINGIVASKNAVIVLCPDCRSLNFAVYKDDEKECKCFVCDGRHKKYDYLKNIRDREEREKTYRLIKYEPYDKVCPSCQKETRIRYNISFDITLYCCLNCFNKETIEPNYEELFNQAPYEELSKTVGRELTPQQIYKIIKEVKKSRLT
jgi:hypothetical protein